MLARRRTGDASLSANLGVTVPLTKVLAENNAHWHKMREPAYGNCAFYDALGIHDLIISRDA